MHEPGRRIDARPPCADAPARMFVAAPPDPATRARLAQLQHQLAVRLPGEPLRQVHPADLHLTLRFLGDVAPSQRPAVRQALVATAARHPPCSAALVSVAAWPPRAPRLLVAEFDAAPALHRLADDLERTVRGLGFAADPRPFRPHVTLARCRPPASGAAAAQAIDALVLPSLALAVRHIVLFRSEPTAAPPRYVALDEAPLGTR